MDDVFVDGDRITLTKGSDGWKIEMAVAKHQSGRPGGFIAPGSGYVHPDPETALKRLREMAAQVQR